jgi:hypothetical protein
MFTTGDPATDKLATDIAAKTIGTIFQKTFEKLGKVPDWLQSKLKEHDPFGTEARAYAEGLGKRYNLMRIVGMSGPVPIRSIYVKVNILDKITSQHRQTVEDLEEVFNKDRNSFGAVRRTEDGIKVVNAEKRLIVLGKPGAGKTTFLKWLALAAVDGKFTKPRIPVFVSLKHWSDQKGSLLDFIRKEFDICGLQDSTLFVDRLLQTGNCLLLLDGLDEVGAATDRAIEEIRMISQKNPDISIVLSCRIASYNYIFQEFKDVEIADFGNEQIEQFIWNWFNDDLDKAKQCIRDLRLPKHKAIANLCPTPLLLTLLCLVYDEIMAFPSNRAELYNESLEALMKRWDASRSIRRETAYQEFSLAKKELLLSKLAYDTFAKNKYFIKQEWLEGEIAAFFANLKNAPSSVTDSEGREILKEIESQHGLLVERAHRIYSFSHLTFQEYFTAKYITRNTNIDRGPRHLIQNYLGDSRWNEVFILTTGLLSEADLFLLDIREALTRQAYHHKIHGAIQKMATLVTSDGLPTPVLRSLAIRFVCGELGKTLSLFRSPFEASKELLRDIQREYDVETIKALRLGLHSAREGVSKILQEISELDPKAVQALIAYIHGTRLLINCLNVDAYVTKEIRAALVQSIFIEPFTTTAR